MSITGILWIVFLILVGVVFSASLRSLPGISMLPRY